MTYQFYVDLNLNYALIWQEYDQLISRRSKLLYLLKLQTLVDVRHLSRNLITQNSNTSIVSNSL